MATPRSRLVDDQVPMFYHLVSKCVQGAWLCGIHPHTRIDYSHRKQWIIDRIGHLAQYFAVEVAAYAIMANHFHLVVYFDPNACQGWSDKEVARRWVDAFPPKHEGVVDESLQTWQFECLLDDEQALAAARRKLGSLSCFVQHLKQPIAWRANREAGCDGDYWANRFYSGALLTEEAVLAAMAYVDLNPVRAQIAQTIEACDNTSVQERLKRLESTPERLSQIMEPIVSGLTQPDQQQGPMQARVCITLEDYLTHLRAIVVSQNTQAHSQTTGSTKAQLWISMVAAIRRKQRAYGTRQALAHWIEKRGMRSLEQALPE
ncbi:MAG: hypothetical protein O7E57_02525 [Gammaproteobacteria bacterium]|nr:hypothetical protein [Gammaproteobacteria bacterium]